MESEFTHQGISLVPTACPGWLSTEELAVGRWMDGLPVPIWMSGQTDCLCLYGCQAETRRKAGSLD